MTPFPDEGTDNTFAVVDRMFAIFPIFFVLVLVLGIVGAVVRVRMARNMAKRAGLDPADATALVLMEENGLSATYLASSLKADASPVFAERGTDVRLKELSQLQQGGLITQAEYDARRAAILESI